MDTDDILKLLLIALFLLPGLFGRKKKKEENQQPYANKQYEYEDPFEDFKSFEDDDSFQEETFETQRIPSPVQLPLPAIDVIPQEEGSSVFTKEQIEAALASIAKQESHKDEISQNEITDKEDDAKNNNSEFLRDFDVRQALIYAEIINPKYFR
ncbi:MAG: hypothetical protein LBF04_06180 [Prevotellaceae bacterium]|jgi:hypothetical protein|nr:hypothetical protein [Prevotellaceae bacterium]